MLPESEDSTSPPPRSGRLETDTFCAACGYNLHAQDVWPDDRLGLLICRCPECGKHHPAGLGTSASSVWLKRLGTLALVLWIAIVVAVAGLLTFALGGMQGAYVGTFTYYQMMTPDGRLVEFAPGGPNQNYAYAYVDQKTRQPVGNVTLRNRLTLRAQNAYIAVNRSDIPGLRAIALMLSIAGGIGFIFGGLLATVLWHWPRRAYWAGCALPLLAWMIATIIYFNADQYELIRGWATERALMIAAIECAGVVIGSRLGRSIARAVCRLVVPPKPRMLLSFLWYADGLVMPMGPPPGGRR